MYLDELLRALFWTVPFAVTVVLSVFLLYLSRKDGDKRKIMFMLCFAFASVGYSNLMLQRFGVPTIWDNNYKWSFVPVTAAASIAIMSSLLKLKSFDRPFKCFLFILGASIVFLVFPSTAEVFRIPLFSAFAMLSLPASIYLFIKRRDNSDLMFFLAFSCFIFSWIALDIGLAEEITVLLTLFGMVFTALMFTVTKDRIAGDMASFFMLQGELEKTREDLKQTQKRAFEELEASEERYKSLCEDARFLMLRMNRKGTVTYVNKFVEEFGLEKKDIVGKSMLKFIPRRNRLRVFKEHISVIRGKNAEGETEIITSKGKLTVEYASNPVRQGGKIVGCETLLRDITEKKEMERKLEEYSAQLEAKVEERTTDLKKSEDSLKTLLNSAQTGIIVIDPVTHTIREANKTAVGMLGGTRDHIVGAICHKFICLAEQGHCPITDLRQTVDNSEGKLLTATGQAIPVIKTVVAAEIGGEMQLVESFIDITERKRLEEKLARAVDQQRSLMRSSAAMIHSTELRQRLQAIVDAIHGLGWRRVVLSVRNEQLDISEPDDLVTAGLAQKEQEFLWTNRQSGKVWRERFGPEFERFKVGEFYYLSYSDPLVKEKFSKGVVLSHLKPEEMVDWNLDDLLYAPLQLADGRIVAVVSMDDPIDGRRPTRESLAPLELFLHQAAVAIENARLIKQLNDANAQIRKHAGQLEAKVEERTRDLVDAQRKLLKSERLAAIGELAGMVGHDLRNPLTGIAGAAYYLKAKSGSKIDEKGKEMLEIIEKAIEYSNKIISDLLDYSREIGLELAETTPKSMLKEAYSSLEIPQNIQVRDETEDTPRMRADVPKMKRVFINIIKNAFDAMPEGGVLAIRSEEIEKHVSFSFTDTGTGMSKEALGKLWTPLFTTKAKGMGFGLPICKRIVEAHRGTISVESTVGKGTIFRIDVPIEPGTEETKDVWVNLPETIQLAKEDNANRPRV
jgi:PAS domain S-box-containing protein